MRYGFVTAIFWNLLVKVYFNIICLKTMDYIETSGFCINSLFVQFSSYCFFFISTFFNR